VTTPHKYKSAFDGQIKREHRELANLPQEAQPLCLGEEEERL
jgi:hypothetical protein